MVEPSEMIGKVILIGVSLYRSDGSFIRKTQVHGVVKEIDADAGIVIQDAAAGGEFYLPPAFGHIHAAAPGVYRSRDTGVEVVDPDFVTQWALRLPDGAAETTVDWQQAMDWRAGPFPAEAKRRLQ